jgi:CHAT domain-containing protein
MMSGFLFAVLSCDTGADSPRAPITRGDAAGPRLPDDPRELARFLAVPPESLRAAGEERYVRQSYDSARAIWEVEVRRARAAGDSLAESRARMWLGLAAWRLGDYAAARREGEAALHLKRRLGAVAELSRSYNALGLLSWNEGKHREALRHFDSAHVTAARQRDAAGMARAAGNIPLVKVELGDFEGARRGFEAALTAGRAIEDDRVQGNALANLAMLDIRLGYPARAIERLAQARRHYRTIEYSTGESNALGQLATAWRALGDLQRAIATADSGLQIARARGLQQEIASTLAVIADLQVQAGSPRLALRLLVEADSLNAASGLAVERGNNLRRASVILLELGETEAAIFRARAALASHTAIEAKSEAVYDRLQLALSHSRAGNAALARSQADSAASLAATLGNPLAGREVAIVTARLAIDRGDPRAALRSLATVSTVGNTGDWRLSDLRAEALFALDSVVAARRMGERSIAELVRERASLGLGPLRSTYLSNRVAPFSRLVAIDLALADTAAAFGVAAMVPGRALAERLGGMTSTAGWGPVPALGDSLLLRAAALETELAEASSQAPGSERRQVLERELQEAHAAYGALLARSAGVATGNAASIAPTDLVELQELLEPDEALLTFLSGHDRLDVFVVTSSSVRHRSLATSDRALGLRIRVARELLSSGRGTEIAAALGDLHEMLIHPAATAGALRGATRLLIVPHGPLAALPFAALRDRKSGRFLIEDYAIVTLPSVSTLSGNRDLNALTASNLIIFSPLPDSLPGTAAEAHAVSRIMRGAEVRMGPASTESAVRLALSGGRSVHIASHGSNNPQSPLFSRMIVGRGRTRGTSDDGRLEVHELLALRTNSPLIFLSGCETALGSGDQTVFASALEEGSLAQAFLAAGAGSVIATLWRVDDRGAQLFAESFYQAMRAGAPPGDALALAQRGAVKAKSGYTWAAYSVSGNARRKSGHSVRTSEN